VRRPKRRGLARITSAVLAPTKGFGLAPGCPIQEALRRQPWSKQHYLDCGCLGNQVPAMMRLHSSVMATPALPITSMLNTFHRSELIQG
jgi:hypothetical protein